MIFSGRGCKLFSFLGKGYTLLYIWGRGSGSCVPVLGASQGCEYRSQATGRYDKKAAGLRER